MAIPTQEQFDEWLDIASQRIELPHCVEQRVERCFNEMRMPEVAETAEYLGEIKKVRSARWDQLMQAPVMVWLSNQREYERAFRLLVFGRRKNAPKPDPLDSASDPEKRAAVLHRAVEARAVERCELEKAHLRVRTQDLIAAGNVEEAERFEKLIGKIDPKPFESKQLRTRLHQIVEHSRPSGSWQSSTIKALREYHYEDAWRRTLELSKTLGPAVASAKASVEALLSQLGEADTLGLFEKSYRLHSLQSFLDRIDLMQRDLFFPIHRKDSLARERLFVFRLQAANRLASRKPKPEAILELMGLEGFSHQYDLRTVERMCAEFAGK